MLFAENESIEIHSYKIYLEVNEEGKDKHQK